MSKRGWVRWSVMPRACVAGLLVLTWASQASAGVAPAPDVNGDGIVNAIDIAMVGRCLGRNPHSVDCTHADVDQDGDVDVSDLQIVVRSRRRRRPTATRTATPLQETATATATATDTPVVVPTDTPVIVPTDTPQPSAIPTPTATNSPVPSATGTATPLATVTATATGVPTETATDAPTDTPTSTATGTATVSQTASASFTSTGTPTATFTPTQTATNTSTRTSPPLPTFTPVPILSHTPTIIPSNTPINTSTQTPTSTVDAGLPPDPAAVAPPVDQSVVTTMQSATAFLYTGANPIQTGVAPGTIDAQRSAVVRGRVTDRTNAPLAGVHITVLDHPEFGQTLTRADGMFDLAVNGGGPLTIDYTLAGYLPAQRQVDVPWQDFVAAADVVLIPRDTQVTAISANAATMQVARGSVVNDSDGTRQATVLFPAGTGASIVLPDGTLQPVATLNIRATEYTVGGNGPHTMPAELPPTSAYTYAVELSADEAVAKVAGRDVVFTQAVPIYVENFLGFPVGVNAPVGYYDRDAATWVPSNNGRVIKITGISGGVATVDTVGTQGLPPLVLDSAELQTLASLYPVGQELWRAPVTHFSTWDINWGSAPPDDAEGPDQDPEPDQPLDCQDQQDGSIIGCQNQTLGEVLGVVGTPFSLHYQSERAPGNKADNTLEIPLSRRQPPAVPAGLRQIELLILVAGQVHTQSFVPAANLRTTFTWDGKDVYGRTVQGAQPITVRVGYTYEAQYSTTSRFGYNGGGAITGSRARREVTLWLTWYGKIGGWNERAAALGGWTLSAHHAYDAASGVLYRGDGERQAGSVGPLITTVAGGFLGGGFGCDAFGDGGPATQAEVCPRGLAAAPDGSLYIANLSHRVQRIAPSGIITTVAGTGVAGFSGDGGPATQARLNTPYSIAVGLDGSLYIGEINNARVRRVGLDGIITTVAGNGTGCAASTLPCGDGGPATLATVIPASLAVGPDGSLYIGDGNTRRVRRVDPDGIIATVAGNGGFCSSSTDPCGDGGLATRAGMFRADSIAVDRNGSVYISDASLNRVRRVTPDGIIQTIAGTGAQGFSGDGGLATQATFRGTGGIALGRDESLYIFDAFNRRIRWVRPGGTINTLAGNGTNTVSGDGGPAAQAGVLQPDQAGDAGLAVGPDGSLYLTQLGSSGPPPSVRRISSGAAGLGLEDSLVASRDGSEVYLFANGRHLRTVDALTGALRHQFAYDSAGRLVTVTDGDNNVTTIERGTSGEPIAIAGPFGQRTTLTTNADGYLDGITGPTGAAVQNAYTTDGLLADFTNPRSHTSHYGYDTLGRLTSATDPTGATKTLQRIGTNKDYTVTLTSPLGRTITYRVEHLATGDLRVTTNSAATGQVQILLGTNAVRTITQANGTTITAVLGPDPRWRMHAPVVRSMTLRTPSGLTYTYASQRTATLTNPTDLLSLSRLTETVTVNGRVFTRTYDAATRTITDSSPAGRRDITVVDSRGWPVQTQFGGIAATDFAYDLQGRLATITQANGTETRTTTFGYTGTGFLQSITDPANHTASYSHDPDGRITELTLPDGATSRFSYDATGNLSTLTPPDRTDHLFAYTENSQPSGYTAPMVGTQPNEMLASYDADRLPLRVDRADGETRTFHYDTEGRLSLIDVAEGDTQYGYDNAGRLATLDRDQGANLGFTYDGDLLLDTTWTGAIDGSVARVYDNNLRTTSLSVNGTDPIALTYDLDGLPVHVGALTLTRDALNGRVTASALGSITDATTYDAFAAPATYTASHGGNAVYSTTYVRDALGRIASKSETINGVTQTLAYTYDPAGRLVEVWHDGSLTTRYIYDANGNRLSRAAGGVTTTATYDAQDRLNQFGATTYIHNAAGERESQTAAGETTSYEYDGQGNLTGVTLPDTTQIEYVLDGQERRVGRKINGTLLQAFLYQDDLKPIAELDGGNNVVSRFVYSDGINVPAYMIRSGVTYRILTDHLGSPRLVIDAATGAIVQRMDYDEFGGVTLDTNPGFQPFGFAGGLYDSHTGLVHFGAREYDPESGSWTTKDPLGFGGGDTNLQAYVRSDPINGIDPRGLFCDGGFTCGILRDERELLEGRMSREDYRERQVARALGGTAGVIVVAGVLSGAAIYEGLVSAANSLGGWIATRWAACTTTSATATALTRSERLRQRLVELAQRDAANVERLHKMWQASEDKFNAVKLLNPGDVAGAISRWGGR